VGARPLNFTVRSHVRAALQALLTLVVGLTIARLAIAAMCSIPGIKFSNACGHNAYMWLPITIPIGLVLSWLICAKVLRVIWPRRET